MNENSFFFYELQNDLRFVKLLKIEKIGKIYR